LAEQTAINKIMRQEITTASATAETPHGLHHISKQINQNLLLNITPKKKTYFVISIFYAF